MKTTNLELPFVYLLLECRIVKVKFQPRPQIKKGPIKSVTLCRIAELVADVLNKNVFTLDDFLIH